MEEKEFKKQIKKVSEHRVYKVTNSYGVYDCYKYYRKNKPKEKKYILTESQYFSIIRKVNLKLVDKLLRGDDIEFPCDMGKLEVKKYYPWFDYSKNKLKTNLPVDWDATLKLWYNDEESYHKKQVVRVVEKELFAVHYNKGHATYVNQSFYLFAVNRDLRLRLRQLIRENKFDAFM